MMKDQRLQQNGLAERDKLQMEQNKDRSDYIKAKQAEHDLHEREVMHERRVQEAKMMKDQRLMQQNGLAERDKLQMEQTKDRSDYIKAKKAEHDLHEREVMHERRVQEA